MQSTESTDKPNHPETSQPPATTPPDKPSRKDMLLVGVIGLIVGTAVSCYLTWAAARADKLAAASLLFVASYFGLVFKGLQTRQCLKQARPDLDKALDSIQWVGIWLGFVITDWLIAPFII